MAGRKSTFDKLRERKQELESGDARGGKRAPKSRLTPPPDARKKKQKKEQPDKREDSRY